MNSFVYNYYSNIFHILNLLFVVGSGLFIYKSSLVQKLLILFLFATVYMDLAASYYGFVFHSNTQFYNYWILIYYSSISLLLIFHNSSNRNIFISILLILILWGCVDTLLIQGKIPAFISYFILPISLFISIQSYLSIKKNIEQIDIPILKNELFIFNIANLIYFPASMINISTINYFSEHNSPLGSKLYTIHRIIYSLWFFVILLGFIIHKWKQPKLS